MKNLVLTLFVAAVLLAPQPGICSDDNTYSNPTVGFSITKPDGWHFISAEAMSEVRSRTKLNDEELAEMRRKLAKTNPQLVAITKYQEPSNKVNPSVQVYLNPLGDEKGIAPAKLLEMTIPALKRAYGDIEVVEGVEETTVDGRPAAYLKCNYSVLSRDGVSYKITMRMCYVIRGDFVFVIGMTGPREGDDVSDEEFSSILDTIRIED